jgi:hypothetical protein
MASNLTPFLLRYALCAMRLEPCAFEFLPPTSNLKPNAFSFALRREPLNPEPLACFNIL